MLLRMLGAGMATCFPLREGMAQLGVALFTRQSSCALPARSAYSKLDVQPVELLVKKSPFESAAQSNEVKLFQPFNTSSRLG